MVATVLLYAVPYRSSLQDSLMQTPVPSTSECEACVRAKFSPSATPSQTEPRSPLEKERDGLLEPTLRNTTMKDYRSGRSLLRPSVVAVLLLVSTAVTARGPSYPTHHLRDDSSALENAIPAAWILEQQDVDETSLKKEEDFGVQPPSISVSDIAKALLYTADLNRKIQHNVHLTSTKPESVEDDIPKIEKLRGGGRNGAFKVPLTNKKNQPGATVFHGVVRGPRGGDLEAFLYQALDLITDNNDEDNDRELEMTLAMIYLDRACSLDTERKQGAEACPFSTPATVHRLLLTSLLLSASSLRTPDEAKLYKKVEKTFGVPVRESENMVEWMRSAQGESGIFVTPEEMRDFRRFWEKQFSPAKAI